MGCNPTAEGRRSGNSQRNVTFDDAGGDATEGDASPIELPTIRSGSQHSVRVSLEGTDGRRVERMLLVDTGADTVVLPASMIGARATKTRPPLSSGCTTSRLSPASSRVLLKFTSTSCSLFFDGHGAAIPGAILAQGADLRRLPVEYAQSQWIGNRNDG